MNYKLYHGDCLEVMDELIESGIVFDMILVDPPYKKTRGRWDNIIPINDMWNKANKLIKSNGAICVFGNEPYSSMVRLGNIENYKYDWKWVKNRATRFANCNYRPMAKYEDIMVFSKANASTGGKNNALMQDTEYIQKYTNYPNNILEFNCESKYVHPTQKPVDLLEYLIKTYTDEGDLVLDFTMGSGSTGVACLNLNRKFIGIELDKKYFDIAKNKIENN